MYERRAGYGLELSVTYTLRRQQKATELVKSAVEPELKLTNHMKKRGNGI